MDSHHPLRRSFLLAGSGLAAANLVPAREPQPGLTAAQVIGRIKSNIGIPWRQETVDKIVAGDPNTPVKGIATTMMATLEVIQRASAMGKNMVITHEPTFYSHLDTTSEFKDDDTYQFKANFIRRNNMVIFRFHDHQHSALIDGIASGMTRDLGWEKNVDAKDQHLFSFPATPLVRFARDIEARLAIRTMRVVGDPALAISRAIANWGYVSQMPGIRSLARPDVDVLIGGETREWEVVEYAQDMIASGKKKALILLGHVLSEQAGMKYLVEWMKPFLPEVPIEFVAASEPFWRPDSPVA